MEPVFFQTPADFRAWLVQHHATTSELWVGYYKKDSGLPSLTWPESVDEALCFGWIDGLRKSIDAISYKIRFTPRQRGSIWSAVNLRRMQVLLEGKKVHPAGLKAYEARKESRSGIYAYEQRSVELVEPYRQLLRQDNAAWNFFQEQPAFYRKLISWWISSAKREETRLKRLEKLIAFSARGERLPGFKPAKPTHKK